MSDTQQPQKDTISRNVITVKTTSDNRIRKILKVLSALMEPVGLSDKEIDIVALLHQKGGDLTTEVRKEICTELNMTVPFLNNYIGRLREKKIIAGDVLHRQFRSLAISDTTQDYLLLLQFVSKDQSLPNEEHDSSNSGGGTPDGQG
jgi:DNA-binding MarR family transcriptional regulator